MIKIDDEYRITADTYCYTLEKVGTVEDVNSKNYGKEKSEPYGYYPTIAMCFSGYIKAKTRKYISDNTYNTIADLVKYIEDLEKFIKDKFKNI